MQLNDNTHIKIIKKVDSTDLSHKKLRFLSVLNDIFKKKKSGHALPEAYNDETGALLWEEFVKISDPEIQYTFQSEVDSINNGTTDIASIISNDTDLDQDNLIIIEKGCGSQEAIQAKTLGIIKALLNKNMKIGMYSPWDCSEEYRNEAINTVSPYVGEVNPLDVDFNNDDPNITTNKTHNVGRPRIVVEFGSTRGNIPTSETDPRSFAEQTYTELQRRFKQDRINCRDEGFLILGTDATDDASARNAYNHHTIASFFENLIHRGLKENVLTNNFAPEALKYEPIWDAKNHVVKHTLISQETQHFGILNTKGEYQPARINKGEHFVLNHSIKWPVDKIISAAESQGFKCLNVYWGEDKRVPVYIFKAVPVVEPALKVIS